jgi:Fe-S-cluster-containing dehydrogenase component
MSTWNMVIDVALCHDCDNCFLSCKDEYVGNDFPGYSVEQPWSGQRWMNIERKERGQYPMVQVAYLPTPCMHCQDAPCMADSPAGTIHRREDGLVIIDPEKAKGHPEIVDTCTYGVIYWNEQKQVPQKCTGCAHLMDAGWTETRCSQVCPTGALKLILADAAAMAAKAEAESLERFRADLGAKPRVWYKNLHRWTKSFIGGTVVFRDTDECADGAITRIVSDGRDLAQAVANNYGDFRIDGLSGGHYEVVVGPTGYDSVTLAVDLAESKSLGVIFLERQSNGQ